MDSNTILIGLIVKFIVMSMAACYAAKKQADETVENKAMNDEWSPDAYKNAFKLFFTIFESLVLIGYLSAFIYWYFHFHKN